MVERYYRDKLDAVCHEVICGFWTDMRVLLLIVVKVENNLASGNVANAYDLERRMTFR